MAEKNERQRLKPHRRGTPIEPAAPGKPASRPAAQARPARARQKKTQLLPVVIVLAALFVVGCALGIRAALAPAPETPPALEGPTRVSFVAVGDNLPEIEMAAYADAQAGETGDGDYDYTPIYAPIRDYVQAADLAYVKQETHLGGDDIGPKGYPSFNTTDQMADALVDAGFDLVGSASNHSYDWGSYGANEHSRSVWNSKPVAFAGTASSAQEADELALVEREGITFALLDYTYGVNGYEREDLPDYAVSFIDRDRIAADVERAREQADVVLVAMHWGTENLMEADQTQREYAQYLADLGVDVVLGSHPHVIGPVTWLTGEGGNRTLVAYSLGNFTSNHEVKRIRNELEGMLSCDFVKDDDVSIENVRWTPLVMHTDGTSFAVYALKDYTPELAAAHPGLAEEADPIAWLRQTSSDVVNALGDEFPIDM
ncbi:CapA family protein [Olsenella sp. An293]|uniref:CapA family protein n=1 Tax=Olsenella sp. An293 TaxID=1965626 RepID=UPI000B38D4CB|nr:CapA family protein [Olsenella sp. An293]OUO33060.1 capsule biosynthesis protein CapA [Olsenella sp. An293]